MTLDYQKIWNVMNSLEMVAAKICSAREILDSAIDKLEEHQYDKAGTLLYAADEFLQYYLDEFDEKFKLAWQETVVAGKEENTAFFNVDTAGNMTPSYISPVTCDKDDQSPECKGSWNNFWEENYYPQEYKGSTVSSVGDDCMPPWGHSDMEALSRPDWHRKIMPKTVDKVKKWVLPVEELGEMQFITFPDDLLEAANLKEGDSIEWVDKKDGSYILKKVPQTYDEMIAAGYTMTNDGFWIKE